MNFLIYLILILWVNIASATDNYPFRVVGYFPSWGIYARNYQVTNVPAMKITDINYAFVNIKNGECVLGDPWADVQKHFPAVTNSLGTYPEDSWNGEILPYYGNLHRLNILKQLAQAKSHPVNILLSIGGWSWSGSFSDIARTPESRAKFVKSCVSMMREYNMDGIDIDWEYPVTGGLQSNITRAEDKKNYTLLLQDFRASLGPEALLTIAAPGSVKLIPNFEWFKISNYVNWVNVMGYDYHGGWDSRTGHHAGLYSNPLEPMENTYTRQLNAKAAVEMLLKSGLSPKQIVLGVASYGRGWQNVNASNNGLFQSGKPASIGTWEAGVFDYKDLIANYLGRGYTRYFDGVTKSPYLYNKYNRIFITYEDVSSIHAKTAFIRQLQLGGAMIWEMSSDIRSESSSSSLISTLSKDLLTQ